ncbi:SDR family NAD(P)-dependent oxidoreductase [Streptomyces sp. NPDC093269]|uniref:SDR family NAD(P)-dependent oxidoreductase n=1 Tax=Streptomyces sp. NPDC093269 TaxID=3366038 RepID=UPI00381830A7
MTSTWLITGATSGFGRLVAERALAAGAHVIAVGRRSDRLAELADSATEGHVTELPLDITAPDAEQVLADAVQAAGGLDVLVNNAGYGLFGPVEQIDADKARAIFETNVLANLAVLRATLPALRASRGRIVQISSLNGQFAWASSGLYSASKAAVELAGEALAHELAPTGAKVTIVEPGVFATEFAARVDVVARTTCTHRPWGSSSRTSRRCPPRRSATPRPWRTRSWRSWRWRSRPCALPSAQTPSRASGSRCAPASPSSTAGSPSHPPRSAGPSDRAALVFMTVNWSVSSRAVRS